MKQCYYFNVIYCNSIYFPEKIVVYDWEVMPYLYNINYAGLREQTIVQKNAILGNLTVTGPLTLYFGERQAAAPPCLPVYCK